MATEPNVWFAAALVLESLARSKGEAAVASTTVGETNVTFKSASDLSAMAKQLRTRGSAHMLPSAGGIYVADKERADSDPSIVKGSFRVGLHDYDQSDPLLGGSEN